VYCSAKSTNLRKDFTRLSVPLAICYYRLTVMSSLSRLKNVNWYVLRVNLYALLDFFGMDCFGLRFLTEIIVR